MIKLSPWWKGPEWESQLGQGTEGLEPYRLQLLNGKAPRCPNPAQTDTDVQMPLSRLTPLHTPAPTPPRHQDDLLNHDTGHEPRRQVSSFSELQTKQAVSDESAKTPGRTERLHGERGRHLGWTGRFSAVNTLKARAAGPKVAFPDAHLGDLLKLIEGNTKIRTDLVSFLRDQFEKVASKGAIEAKLKEVAVREGKSKDIAWRVKPEFWTAAGCLYLL